MNDVSFLSRRDFVRTGLAGTAVLLGNALPVQAADARLPQRVFGKTGVKVPILGLGTVAVGNLNDAKKGVALINKAIDLGVTYIDTAPPKTSIAFITGYGKAHAYLNGVLKERRKEIFLVTKCLETDGKETLSLLKKNLEELGIGQVDLAYTHSIGHAVYDFDALVGDSGPMAVLEKAKKDGLTRFVGITGHNRPEKFAKVDRQPRHRRHDERRQHRGSAHLRFRGCGLAGGAEEERRPRGDEGLRRRHHGLQDARRAACTRRSGSPRASTAWP